MDYPCTNSTECASYNMYGVTQEPTYHLGEHAKKNILFDDKNTNSSFSNLDYNLNGSMSRNLQDNSLYFNYHETPSSDVISFENHQTHSPLLYPEPTSRVYITNDVLNPYNSPNFPKSLKLKNS
ncbi:hypothetical protein NPIL_118281 [Nephila pilipes]|uniref:Uncharacterized protein n=1 Tax=Nephila pilipes TaxID=299642 RepID=A0A8X6Q6P5_NEPPI|nr:hypothetical protein NPIL_118281 [Nephila pilipes]